MEQTIKTTAKQDAEARQLLYSKSPEEKEQVKAAKAAWKKNNSNRK